jgi:hypothetical protein
MSAPKPVHAPVLIATHLATPPVLGSHGEDAMASEVDSPINAQIDEQKRFTASMDEISRVEEAWAIAIP